MKQFKIRASGAYNLMGKKGLGQTGETYIETWLKENIYERSQEFSNKYVKKGIAKEDDLIKTLGTFMNVKDLKKNEEHFEDDFMTGTPDVLPENELSDTVIDVKNSFDCFTFPLFVKDFISTEVKTFKTVEDKIVKTIYAEDYYAQGQVYMHLTGRTKYKLVYGLMDTPEEIIRKDFKYHNKHNLEYEEFRKDYLYEHLPVENRIKVFEFKYDPNYIKTIIKRVNEARKYIKKIYE